MTIDYNTQNGLRHIQNVNSMINSFSRFPVSAKYHDIFSQKQTKDEMLQDKKYNNALCLSDCPSLLLTIVIFRRPAQSASCLRGGDGRLRDMGWNWNKFFNTNH